MHFLIIGDGVQLLWGYIPPSPYFGTAEYESKFLLGDSDKQQKEALLTVIIYM